MTLQEFLVWLSGVGAVALVSWLFERFKWFQNADPQKKQMIFFGVCAAVAVSAQCVNLYVPVEVLNQIAPYFATIASIFIYLFLGEQFHAATKLPKE